MRRTPIPRAADRGNIGGMAGGDTIQRVSDLPRMTPRRLAVGLAFVGVTAAVLGSIDWHRGAGIAVASVAAWLTATALVAVVARRSRLWRKTALRCWVNAACCGTFFWAGQIGVQDRPPAECAFFSLFFALFMGVYFALAGAAGDNWVKRLSRGLSVKR